MLDKRAWAEYHDKEKVENGQQGSRVKPAPKQRSSDNLDPLMANGFTPN